MGDYVRRLVARAEGAAPVSPRLAPRPSAPPVDDALDPFAAPAIAAPTAGSAPSAALPGIEPGRRDSPRSAVEASPFAPRGEPTAPAPTLPAIAPRRGDALTARSPRARGLEAPIAGATPLPSPLPTIPVMLEPRPPGEGSAPAEPAAPGGAQGAETAAVSLAPTQRLHATPIPGAEPPRPVRREPVAAQGGEPSPRLARAEPPARPPEPQRLAPRSPAQPLAPPAATAAPIAPAGPAAPRLVIGRVIVEVASPAAAVPHAAPRVSAPRSFRAGAPAGSFLRRPFGLGQS
ncbi:hypothetical protein [Sorangium sp. So ce1097]|uniref:hypothetical protein n=1 Tax=Sorangium sp. So ce1097 TaxID=3133330 RepID=UPI003F618413